MKQLAIPIILTAALVLAGCPPQMVTSDPQASAPHRYDVWWSPAESYYDHFQTDQITHNPSGSISFHADWVQYNKQREGLDITLTDSFAIGDHQTTVEQSTPRPIEPAAVE